MGTVHSSTCGPLPESNMIYRLFHVSILPVAARERNVVFGFCKGPISEVWSEKPDVQFHELKTRELRSGTAKRIKWVKDISVVQL